VFSSANHAYVAGFSLGLGLILAIGAQNAFVLRQGLRREHVAAVALTCALSDAALIAAGVAGFGVLVARAPAIEPAMRYGGAAFLAAYAFTSLRAAFHAGTLSPAAAPAAPLARTLATTLALTWLNPHVYLDTVVLLGAVSTQFPGEAIAFALGATSASFAFFFTLGYGAGLLRPFFARRAAWRALDALIAATMGLIALRLVLGA